MKRRLSLDPVPVGVVLPESEPRPENLSSVPSATPGEDALSRPSKLRRQGSTVAIALKSLTSNGKGLPLIPRLTSLCVVVTGSELPHVQRQTRRVQNNSKVLLRR
jgi:hypothetical protein